MNASKVIDKIIQLPSELSTDVKDYLNYLNIHNITENIKPRAKFGELKGFVKYIAEDFDAPLEDFKEYM